MPSQYFGWSLALAGDTLAIGNRGRFSNDLLPGTVHIFQRNETVWNCEQIVKAREGAVADLFGRQIALSGRMLVATSARGDETTYVYELDAETWSPWKGMDVGTLSARGGEGFANGTFTVAGAGADIWGQGDEFHFVYRQWTGNGEIVGRISGLEETEGWAKAGVMFRESLDPTARNALAFVTPRNGAGFQRRATLNGGTEFTHGAPLARAPSWVKVVRKGNEFTAYHSVDGVRWMFGGSAIIDIPENVYVGLAVTSHRDGTLCTATFDNVSVTDGSTAAVSTLPFISDVKRTTGDVMEVTSHGEPGKTYRVEASRNLVDWRLLATQLNASGSFVTRDADAANHPARFYRVVLLE
jgi:hypothetical protein